MEPSVEQLFIWRKVHLILIAFCLKLLLLFLWFRLVLSCHKKEKEKKSTARLLTLKPLELPGRIQMPSIYCCCKVQSGATAWEPYWKRTEKLKWAHYTTKDYKSRNAGCIGQMLQGLECPQLWRLPQIAVPHHAAQNCHWSDTSYPARKHPNTRTAGECIIHNTQQQSESDNTVIRHQQCSGLCEHSQQNWAVHSLLDPWLSGTTWVRRRCMLARHLWRIARHLYRTQYRTMFLFCF